MFHFRWPGVILWTSFLTWWPNLLLRHPYTSFFSFNTTSLLISSCTLLLLLNLVNPFSHYYPGYYLINFSGFPNTLLSLFMYRTWLLIQKLLIWILTDLLHSSCICVIQLKTKSSTFRLSWNWFLVIILSLKNCNSYTLYR